MIDRLVAFALHKRLVVAMICIFAAIYGYYSWTQLALEAYPDIADVTSQVITQAPGLAAEEVEQQITIPLERELNGTPGLFVMRSKSTFGLSLIVLVFRDASEDYWSRRRILESIGNKFQLELDPTQLMRFNLSLKNVTDAINANSANAGGSVLTRGELGYVIRGIGLVQTLDDMGDIVVTQRSGTPIFVRDLGILKLSSQERHGILGKDEKNDTIEGITLLLRAETPSPVLARTHATLPALTTRLKP